MPYKDTWTNLITLFGGMNINDTPDQVTQKNQAEFILNCYSSPEGAISKLFGRSKHNSVAIGANAEITGIYELSISSRPFYCVSEDKFYKDNAGAWVDKTGGVTITDDKNNLWDFLKFQELLIGVSLGRDTPIEHDGGSGNAANVTNMPVVKFAKPLKDRIIAYSTLAQPKLGYWCAIDDRNTWDDTTDFLNFKGSENDNADISGVAEHLDNHIVGKDTSLFRVYYTGTVPAFQYYRIDEKIGVAGHLTMQSLPAAGLQPAKLVWMGKDNFYQLVGDIITAIGDDIKPFFSSGAPFQINLSRLPYFTSGIIREKNLYWCSFSSGSNSSNDYNFILDYKNMMWALCDFPINSFGKRTIQGREFLYSGTVDGFVCKHDPAIYNNLGVAYSSIYVSSWLDWGDTQLEKKVRYFIALMDAVGAYDLQVEYRPNLTTDWINLGIFSAATGGAKIGVDFTVGTSVLGGANTVESVLEVMKRFKRIQLRFTQATLNQRFSMFAMGALWSPVKGYRIGS